MNADLEKQRVAKAALAFVEEDTILGVGTGSTCDYFIDFLAQEKIRLKGAVASSQRSAKRLIGHGFEVFDANSVSGLSVYVDGADEITEHLACVKGGGAALTQEKIVAALARKFVCIADSSKLVGVLGKFPLPVEVIPAARSYVARKLMTIGGQPVWRQGVITDNGNVILDVHGLTILNPVALEQEIEQWVGVVCCGLFAKRSADILLLAETKADGSQDGVRRIAVESRAL